MKVHWFRSTIFQILVVGGVFFCVTWQGMYNALSSLGAGGLATPWYANATAAAGYVFMAVLCIVGGIIVSKIGVRWALLVSVTGDIIYAGSLYLNSKNGTQWFLMFGKFILLCLSCFTYNYTAGSIISGMTDGLMYSVEGPIITSYPEEDRRGRMLGLWVFMRNAAPVIGGAIIFGLNSSINSTGAVSLKTYLVIIGIMCAGPFIALLLSNPEQVQRKDGVKIALRKTGWIQTFTEWFRVVSNKHMLLLCPLFFTSWFYGSYISTLQTQYFNVRTRALCAFVIPWGDISGGFMIGYFLDSKRFTVKQRARWSFIALMVLNLALWLWAAIVTKQLEDTKPEIDWTSGSFFGRTFALFLLFDLATMATQTSLYWIISHMSGDFLSLSYMTGTLRGVECAGQAVAYGIKSSDTTDWLSIGLNVGLIVFSLPFAWAVIRKVGVAEFNIIRIAETQDRESVVDSKSLSDDEKDNV
ncbi:MFS general substrate transporter [Guyanagaster necrorhizus]|uniref:MFS general substrate transporter n=1 Tax=Guyanagaster necrorhizus TaxID=856835 RepID=A0A9P7VW84_9AGAR|nr:MFS general substrate transporter [Guyanagaster necrorhizus MCA 3950]KAG7448104.1 MFS general substrate transporter [Guyanagaster necrorhizus MCA 3950]